MHILFPNNCVKILEFGEADNMKRSVGLWQFFGFAVVSLLGPVLHFLYEWLGEPLWVAPFSGVNESTWEHMKLLFFPMLIFAVFQSFFFREYGEFWCIKLRGILSGLFSIPILFYTYNGAIEKSPDWLNIVIFFISVAISFCYETKLFRSGKVKCKSPKLAITVLIVVITLFVTFTFYPPSLGIFRDPITGGFGV